MYLTGIEVVGLFLHPGTGQTGLGFVDLFLGPGRDQTGFESAFLFLLGCPGSVLRVLL